MNKSGIEPCGNRVLIKPDEIEEVTEGGIVIPSTVKDRHQMSACYGVVVALGPDCFCHTTETTERLIDGGWKEVERKRTGYGSQWAKPGDRIAFAIYSGLTLTGEDGIEYKLMNDEDITGRVTKSVVQTSIEPRKAV